jgi:CBS domain-containing protein
MRARDIMTERVIAVAPNATVRHAAEILADHGFTALPVVDENDDVVGVVSEVDLITSRFPHDPRYRHLPPASSPATVGTVMSRDVFTVDPDAELTALVEQMWQHRHRCVPVLRERRLVGIITRRDVVRVMARGDVSIAQDVVDRLAACGGPTRWNVRVADGRVDIQDRSDDVAGRRAAVALAESVPGVTDVYVSGADHDA